MTATPGGEPAPDDWDHHWEAYGEAAQTNPANRYRRELILQLLGVPRANSTILDIGSGQGAFAVFLSAQFPQVDVWGVEYSTSGVARSKAAAAAAQSNARFSQRDLLQPVELETDQRSANYAICSEVLEHIDDPVRLLENARSLLAPGCRLVVTVPGGPRSAFDKHIGHLRHYTDAQLRQDLTSAGYQVDRVLRAGFPFFNLYKLAVIARGKRLISDIENQDQRTEQSTTQARVTRFFDKTFKVNLDDFPLGWQLAAVARVPD